MESVQINGKTYDFAEYHNPGINYDVILSLQEGIVGSASLSQQGGMARILDLKGSRRPCFYFNRLIVKEEFRGRKLGSFLLDKVIEFAQREKVPIITEINPYGEMDLKGLTDFYMRRGFKILEERTIYWLPE